MLLKALHVYTSDDRSDSSEKENADNNVQKHGFKEE